MPPHSNYQYEQGKTLLQIARNSIARALNINALSDEAVEQVGINKNNKSTHHPNFMPATISANFYQSRIPQAPSGLLADEVVEASAAPWLFEPGATFITLTQHDRLRGCIGSLQAHQPLIENISNNAVSAALHDSRFPSVTADEFDTISVEVSLLSALNPLLFASEAEVLAQLRPGIDGILLESGIYRSTFLPQVWESLPQPREFLTQLKLKAGLDADFWDDYIQLSRYTVQKWREVDFYEEKSYG